jgi:hypothetical protein
VKRFIKRVVILCVLVLGVVLFIETCGFPNAQSVFHESPSNKTPETQIPVGAEGSLSVKDYKEIKSVLRPLVYRGHFFDRLQILNSNEVQAVNFKSQYTALLVRTVNGWEISFAAPSIMN